MDKDIVQQSKFLSRVLRHQPERINIRLDSNGWVPVDLLIEAYTKHGMILNREMLERIVEQNNKKRFSFSEDGLKIRANQGHSVTVDLNLEPIEPPERLYHGTAGHNLPSIRKNGLVKGKRHHVHLSENPTTAHQVGQRHGKPVILQIAAKQMHQDGYPFYRSANGVWLTEFVPVRYIKEK